jgi:hypothetical protein
MPTEGKLSFSEVQIQSLFGHEAAEDEPIERLREYYFKSSTYDQVVTELPLRILVGHKGIGKSALFQVGIAELKENGQAAILLHPDDVATIAVASDDFLKSIRDWKVGLIEVVVSRLLASFGAVEEDLGSKIKRYAGRGLDFARETLKGLKNIDYAPAQKAAFESLLKGGGVSVFIDDLDRGWEGKTRDVKRISALLNALRDLTRENPGLRFRLSLRSDVYYLVRTADESTDKIEGSVIWQSWTNHEILLLLIKRIETFFGRAVDERALLESRQRDLADYLKAIMEPYFSGNGHWENAPMYRVLMSLIRKRPRDLVKLLTLAGRRARASESGIIRTIHLRDSFEEYSQGRVQDTVNEYRSELPEIERLLLNMKPSRKERSAKEGYTYRTDALLKKIGNIAEGGAFCFAGGRVASARELAAFMYKINFLTARKEAGPGIRRLYFEENRYLSSQLADFGFDWEVHPAYRWALQPDTPERIFSTLELSVDDQ